MGNLAVKRFTFLYIMDLLVSRTINLSEILFYLKSGLTRAQFLSTAKPDFLKGIV
jgi:hypothetical protein